MIRIVRVAAVRSYLKILPIQPKKPCASSHSLRTRSLQPRLQMEFTPVANSRYSDEEKAERKAAKKATKAAKRAKREGNAPDSVVQKPCDLCDRGRDLLIRCQIDETKSWKMVCGKCWKDVSGGVVDGDKSHPHYTYGGLWKNRNAKKLPVEDSTVESVYVSRKATR